MHTILGRSFLVSLAFALCAAVHAEWVIENAGKDGHQRLLFKKDGRPVAEFVYGDEELKPYVHVYGKENERLTEWAPDQQFSHHRGIFIGWNRIRSDLGRYDLWHLRNGGRMQVVKPVTSGTTPDGKAFFEAEIEWHGGSKDEQGNSLLLRELRRFEIASPQFGETIVDAQFHLSAARDLQLGGDLQHSGIHFRGSRELLQRKDETSYLWEPPLPGRGGKVESPDLKWCRLLFPIGQNWYSATELNAPSNPVEELSWRDYGRFGFFFSKELAKGEELKLKYRFITEPTDSPEGEKFSDERLEKERKEASAEYQKFLASLKE